MLIPIEAKLTEWEITDDATLMLVLNEDGLHNVAVLREMAGYRTDEILTQKKLDVDLRVLQYNNRRISSCCVVS